MPVVSDFTTLIQRVRAGDDQAAAELVRRYEPEIRRAARWRLHEAGLRRQLESVDICQSVLGTFFVRAALGDFDLERPEQLLALLVTMVRNNVINQALKHQSRRRDHRREAAADPDQLGKADPRPGPEAEVAWREMLQAFRAHLSEEERAMADLRTEGRTWEQVAEAMGGRADARRQQFHRALKRVALRLGIAGEVGFTESGDE